MRKWKGGEAEKEHIHQTIKHTSLPSHLKKLATFPLIFFFCCCSHKWRVWFETQPPNKSSPPARHKQYTLQPPTVWRQPGGIAAFGVSRYAPCPRMHIYVGCVLGSINAHGATTLPLPTSHPEPRYTLPSVSPSTTVDSQCMAAVQILVSCSTPTTRDKQHCLPMCPNNVLALHWDTKSKQVSSPCNAICCGSRLPVDELASCVPLRIAHGQKRWPQMCANRI